MWDTVREFLGAVVSFFYGLVPNLGVAIILLTVAVMLLLFPLTLKQVRSMRAMQQLQPELKRLQKEYVGDKPGLQQATLALYKERGVN
ncbi:MAG: rane protein insertase, YidC/Oxa1 family, partial [Acidobacteria bacterium]|nr:rane protein insertase, YidC/Oxa1 family [Acidobacteriota bacterium]